VFTQDFFTENATHKQNCTSFDPKRVITYNDNYGKPFLNVSRSAAQTPISACDIMHNCMRALPPPDQSEPQDRRQRSACNLKQFYLSSIFDIDPASAESLMNAMIELEQFAKSYAEINVRV
jgi:hypothetical protein